MGIGPFAGNVRKGLVAILLVFALVPVFPQAGPAAPAQGAGLEAAAGTPDLPAGLALKDLQEIERSPCRSRYSSPLNLLFLLPGVLIFLLALLTRRGHRKLLPFFLLPLVLGSGEPFDRDLIGRAEVSFVSGNFREALQLYEQAEEQLPCNSAVLYNLGVLSHLVGRRGYAVHYLRRSLREAPGDRQARRALQRLQQLYDLAGQVPPPLPVHPDFAYLLLLLSTNAAFVLGALVVRTKRVRFLISLVLMAMIALGCLAFFLARLYAGSRPVGVVAAEGSELYRVPEEDSKSWFELPAGTSLWIRGRAGRYFLVQTLSQVEGWVQSEAILVD